MNQADFARASFRTRAAVSLGVKEGRIVQTAEGDIDPADPINERFRELGIKRAIEWQKKGNGAAPGWATLVADRGKEHVTLCWFPPGEEAVYADPENNSEEWAIDLENGTARNPQGEKFTLRLVTNADQPPEWLF